MNRLRGRDLRGVVCALVTPFTASGDVDLVALDRLVEFHAERGTDALLLLGTSGEGLLLAPAERKAVVERAVAATGGRLATIVHCGATETRTAVELAHHAEQCGANAIASIGPLFFPYREAELELHFQRIAQAAPNTDLFIYENPARVGYSLGVPLISRLLADVESIVGVKDTGASVARLCAYQSANSDAVVFTGDNTLLLAALVMGAAGLVSTTSNAVPELFAAVVAAHQAGDLARARRTQLAGIRLQAMVADLPYVPAAKALMQHRGLPVGTGVREPMAQLTAEQRGTLAARLEADSEVTDWLAA